MMPLRHRLGGDDHHALFGQRDALLRGHDDILVVREDEHRLCGVRFISVSMSSVEGFIVWPPGDYPVGAQLAEELRHAHARADRNGAVGSFRARLRPSVHRGGFAPAISQCCSRMFSIFTLSSGP